MYFVDITLTVKKGILCKSECMFKESPRSAQILSRWNNDNSILSKKNLMFFTHQYVSGIGSVPTIYMTC